MPALEAAFRQLFGHLEAEGYAWRALSPERIRKMRGSEGFDPLTLFFGLGEGAVPASSRTKIPVELWDLLEGLRPAVSRVGDRFIAHDHWDAGGELAYLSEETFALLERIPPCAGLRVLDLGSGAGGLSLALSSQALEIVGIEMSGRAVDWARASAAAQGILNVRFERGRVPEFSPGGKFDLVVFNPPMAIPEGTPRPHRDGGALGCELAEVFLEFARAHLRPGGEACFLATSPVVAGRSVFREALRRKSHWVEHKAERLHSHFNQSLARKADYAALGIERVELWCFRLAKAG